MLLLEGVISGLIAGILMGMIAHSGFKAGILKSSLFVIDGTFIQQKAGLKGSEKRAVLIGIPVHLFTSASFGIVYALFTRIFQLDPLNGWLIALYVVLLWISMLFVALPTAGQGLLGRKLGSHTWLEQLVLHVVFGISLWITLYVLL